MTTKRLLFRAASLWIVIVAVSTVTLASGGGSVYSSLGIGDLMGGLSVRNLGMGYTGVALSSSSALNMDAPATWAGLTRTRLEAGAAYQGFSSRDAFASRYIADISFLDAKVGFPIAPSKGISLVAGFTRYSNVDFDTYEAGTGYTSVDTIPYSIHHQGTGGLGVGKLGLSYAPIRWLALGASFDYYFGTINYIRTFLPTSASFLGSRFDRTTSYHGPGGTFGVLMTDFGWLSDDLKPLAVGASVSSRSDVTSSTQTILTFGGDPVNSPSEADTTANVDGTTIIPLSYTVGVSYVVGSRYVLAADYSSQLWKKSSFNGTAPTDLGNSSRFGLGIERGPSRETNASWGERVALRFGGTFGTLYYRPKNTAIDQWLLTAGASFPISSTSRMHMAFEYGARGTFSNGLIRDHIFRLTAAISVGEEWFVPLPEE